VPLRCDQSGSQKVSIVRRPAGVYAL